MLAGEPSGDAHGAGVAREILRRFPAAELAGLGGARMAAAGVRILVDVSELSVMGFAEVVRRLPFHHRLERALCTRLRSGAFDLVLPIDYPGFNMRMARRASRMGVRVLYYIGPQVWAWKRGRARRLAAHADGIALILPFEPGYYRAHGGRAEFVGHPLLDEAAAAEPSGLEPPGERPRPDGSQGTGPRGADAEGLARRLGIDLGRPVLALFPGSRAQELRRHAAPFARAARTLERRVPGLQVVASKVPGLPRAAYRAIPFPTTEDAASLRALATAGLVKSGTGTLEAALAGMPFVVAYVTHPVTHVLARRLVRVPQVGLASLVAGREVAPEFIQREAATPALADALEPLLDRGSPARRRAVDGLAAVRAALGTPGAAARVVDMMEEILDRRCGRARAGRW